MSPEKAKPRKYEHTLVNLGFDRKTLDSMQDLLDANNVVVAKQYASELQRHGVDLDKIQVRTPETVAESFEMESETWRLRVGRELDQKAREQKPSEQRRQERGEEARNRRDLLPGSGYSPQAPDSASSSPFIKSPYGPGSISSGKE